MVLKFYFITNPRNEPYQGVFLVLRGCVWVEAYRGRGRDGPGVCLGDGQTESQGYCRKVDAATRCSGLRVP